MIERETQPGYHATGRSAAYFSPAYGNATVRGLSEASEELYDLDNDPDEANNLIDDVSLGNVRDELHAYGLMIRGSSTRRGRQSCSSKPWVTI